MKPIASLCLAIVIVSLLAPPARSPGQSTPSPTASNKQPGPLAPALKAEIDGAVQGMLAKSGAPGCSIALVKDGRLVYARAYGLADVNRRKPATTAMRYSIGSISKQFAAAAILILAEQGELSLDDPLSRWFPQLTRSGEVTVRQILSMTSGYQDFWPQDYVMPTMMKPVSPEAILKRWAEKPLDFEPGTKWQYSNTNYVIAGLIIERISSRSLMEFLHEHIFNPLEMKSVIDTDSGPLPPEEPQRYFRYGMGPLRPAPKEGKGWLFGAGELAMTASDLAKWDISMIDQTLLKPDSYFAMEKAESLKNGANAQYGLGVNVTLVNGRRLISHNGEVSGFTASNAVYPDDRAAVVVLTNLDATRASINLGDEIASMLFRPAESEGPLAEARAILSGLQKGKIDRSRFTSNANAYLNEQALKDLSTSLAPLGNPARFTEVSEGSRGGMTLHRYRVQFANQSLTVSTYMMPDGRLEQYIVAPEN